MGTRAACVGWVSHWFCDAGVEVERVVIVDDGETMTVRRHYFCLRNAGIPL